METRGLLDRLAVFSVQSQQKFIASRIADESEVVDVAGALLAFPDGVDIRVYPVSSVATQKRMEEEGIGIGDEVFFPGLFARHPGAGRSLPIVRVGNIAAMPEEKLLSKLGPMDGYLVEARSIGGLSGSPVFVHLGLTRGVGGALGIRQVGIGAIYLPGLVHGHFDVEDATAIVIRNQEPINMGIAMVVPIDRILEVLDQPDVKNREKEITKEWLASRSPVMD